jgi:hypothetical protein
LVRPSHARTARQAGRARAATLGDRWSRNRASRLTVSDRLVCGPTTWPSPPRAYPVTAPAEADPTSLEYLASTPHE